MSVKGPKISEAAFQKTVIAAAKALGWLVHHQRPAINKSGKWSSAIQGDAGWPDLICVHPGYRRIIIAELKSDTGKASPDQGRWLAALRNATSTSEDVTIRLWRPRDWPEIERELKCI